uniref:Rho-GAP domain-containing protein n=1 Tax=Syphacia muris TaxID=451379 RepID=A0A0N5AQ83_9BILA
MWKKVGGQSDDGDVSLSKVLLVKDNSGQVHRALKSSHSSCNASDSAVFNTDDATTELIMHRYKAKTTQLGSPNSKAEKSHGSDFVSEHFEKPGTSTTSGSTAGSINEGASTSTNPSVENMSLNTPKLARKWKKSRIGKQSLSSIVGRSEKSATPGTSALGRKIVDCPTTGDGDLVPLLVKLCIGVVEAHGMDTVGIYRIPGNTAAVNALKENLNLGLENVDFKDLRWKDVNVVSSLLKMFLRKLPEPLLTDKLYPIFIDANRITAHAQRLHKLRNLVRKLPAAHYATLKYLMHHLRVVSSHSSVNKMETRNLALMFGPSIVRPSDDSMATMVTHMSDQCKIIETFITYYDWIFNEASGVSDEVPSPVSVASDVNSGVLGKSAAREADGTSQNSFTTASLNDMHDLLRRVNEAEAVALMDAQRGGKLKQMLNVRRNSKKDKARKRDHSAHQNSANHEALSAAGESSGKDSTSKNVYQVLKKCYERNIDAEIASREQNVKVGLSCATGSFLGHSPSLGSSLGSITESSQHTVSRSDNNSRDDVYADVDAMRKKRQQEIYSARRIFISGTDTDPLSTNSGCVDLDDLVCHTRHLNLATSPALDVLSAETREKIRKMQQLQGWYSTANERREADISKRSCGIGDTFCSEESAKNTRKGGEEFSSTDALSLTSDYSTTSSAPLTAPVTVSCVDHLATTSSDYASSDVSPCPHNISISPRPQEPLQTDSSFCEMSSPVQLSADENSRKKLYQFLPSGQDNAQNSDLQTKVISQPQDLLESQGSEKLLPISAGCSSKAQRVKARARASRKDLWRRHTLSDVDIIRQAIAQEKSLNRVNVTAPMNEKSKVSKLARWIKNSFRRSSHDLVVNSSLNFRRGSGFASATVPSSGGPTPPSEIIPSSGDEQL